MGWDWLCSVDGRDDVVSGGPVLIGQGVDDGQVVM